MLLPVNVKYLQVGKLGNRCHSIRSSTLKLCKASCYPLSVDQMTASKCDIYLLWLHMNVYIANSISWVSWAHDRRRRQRQKQREKHFQKLMQKILFWLFSFVHTKERKNLRQFVVSLPNFFFIFLVNETKRTFNTLSVIIKSVTKSPILAAKFR